MGEIAPVDPREDYEEPVKDGEDEPSELEWLRARQAREVAVLRAELGRINIRRNPHYARLVVEDLAEASSLARLIHKA